MKMNGNPKVALHIENEMRWAMMKYKKLHPDNPLPHITPHVSLGCGRDTECLHPRKLCTCCGADGGNFTVPPFP